MYSAVVTSVCATTSSTSNPGRSAGSSTTAAAASANSACATTWSTSVVGGWMCRLVSSRQSSTDGRPRAAVKSATAPSPGSAA